MKKSKSIGLKDTAAKNFFGRPDILASILNYILYNGKKVVLEEQLRETSGAHYRILQEDDGSFKCANRYRDKLYLYHTGKEILSVGLEFQSRHDKQMIPRIMNYDSHRYRNLIDGNKVHRIINIVLEFDTSHIQYPNNLKEMIGDCKSISDGLFYNYGYVSLNIYDIAEKLDIFSCKELKDVLYLFKNSRNDVSFQEALKGGIIKGRLSRDAAIVCAVFLGVKIKIDNDDEEIDMCKAIDDLTKKSEMKGLELGIKKGKKLGLKEGKKLGREEGKKEGIEKGKKIGLKEGKMLGLKEGKKLGREEGKKLALSNWVNRLLKLSYSFLEICKLTGESEKTIQEVLLSLT